MNHSLLLRVTAPAVAVGVLLLATCLAGVSYINRLHRNLADVLSQNVASMQAAQKLETRVRELRFDNMTYVFESTPERLDSIRNDEKGFEADLADAQAAVKMQDEQACIRAIQAGYEKYRRELAQRREAAKIGRSPSDAPRLPSEHHVDFVVVPCSELSAMNRAKMDQGAIESRRLASQGSLAIFLLGLVGAIGGLVMGYGVARGLRQSIYRLSVRMHDMARHLDRDVATVSVAADGNFQSLDRQMQHIVGQVEAVGAQLQRQQRELMRAEQLAAVGQLAAGVAHEIRNPLTGIKMLVEAAQRPNKPRALDDEDLAMIHREIGRLEQTVQGLLDFARLPAPERSRCDIRDIVTRAWELVRARADQQGVTLADHSPTQPVAAYVDGSQIHTVLVNLLMNALDAMPGGGRIEVSCATIGGRIRLSVADTGEGIPPEVADQLFTPFATTKPTGTGLGLSMSARIVQEHDGSIRGENRSIGGACFTIELPEPPEEDSRAHLAGH
jgi:two-component system, NtrC family, sensor histidine kinase HydH